MGLLKKLAQRLGGSPKEVMELKGDEVVVKPAGAVFSSGFLTLMPSDANFVPTEQSRVDVLDYLKQIFPHHIIQLRLTEQPEFISSMESFEGVDCNLCGARMDGEAWGELMNQAHEKQRQDLSYTTPCCNESGNLNLLHYLGGGGFARFSVEVNNADPGTFQEVELVEKFSSLIQHPAKLIQGHL